MCILGSFMYAFFAAFCLYFEEDVVYDDPYLQYPEEDKDRFRWLYVIIEVTYGIDFIA